MNVFDSLHSGLVVDRIPFKALYNRVYPWANLTKWKLDNEVDSNQISKCILL